MPEERLNGEVVDGLPVLREEVDRELLPAPAAPGSGAVVAVAPRHAAALAATGFLAGVAAVTMIGRRRRYRLARRSRWRSKGLAREIVASNSFLVDVHLLRRG